MKFIAKKDVSDKITEGEVYHGSLIWKFELRSNVQPPSTQELKIVVFNNLGKWSEYSPSTFAPYED